MFDYANAYIQKGNQIASDRCVGVNDNMTASHFHDFFEIYYLESGERYHLINDDLYHVTAGQFLIFAPYVMHRSYGDDNMPFSRLLLYFKEEEISSPEIRDALHSMTGAYKLSPQINTNFYHLMVEILDEVEQQNTYQYECAQALLNHLLIIFMRNQSTGLRQAEHNKITDIISYINKNFSQEITIEQLSKDFFISPYYMCRKFKYYTNSTIIQYVNTTRIINAQKLLLNSSKTITEISIEVGFDSLTHFERVYKSVTGMTPKQTRVQKKIQP